MNIVLALTIIFILNYFAFKSMTRFQVLILVSVSATAISLIYFAFKSMTPSKVYLEHGNIIQKYTLKKVIANLNDVVEIKCHYTAAVGFDADWIFILNDGDKFVINYKTKGLDKLLTDLQGILTNFNLSDFDEKDDGFGMVDVWKRAQ